MRISDWSSDVCSSDLREIPGILFGFHQFAAQADDIGCRRWIHRGLRYLLSGRNLKLRHLDSLLSVPDVPQECLVRHAFSYSHHERSEERRFGKEFVSTCRSRWSAYH